MIMTLTSNHAIVENVSTTVNTVQTYGSNGQYDNAMGSTTWVTPGYTYTWPAPFTYWQGYPVYVTTDKTAKAIEILKELQEEKLIKKIDDVDDFIKLVEKIASKL